MLRILRLVEQVGAETVALSAPGLSAAIVKFSSERNITKIVMGKPARRGWKRLLLGSVVDMLINDAASINFYLLGGRKHEKGDRGDKSGISLYQKSPLSGLSVRLSTRKKATTSAISWSCPFSKV